MKRYPHIIISLVLCISFCSALVVYSSAALKGDLDNDGRVTTVDARTILSIASGHITPTVAQKKLADMNGDGIIDEGTISTFECIEDNAFVKLYKAPEGLMGYIDRSSNESIIGF